LHTLLDDSLNDKKKVLIFHLAGSQLFYKLKQRFGINISDRVLIRLSEFLSVKELNDFLETEELSGKTIIMTGYCRAVEGVRRKAHNLINTFSAFSAERCVVLEPIPSSTIEIPELDELTGNFPNENIFIDNSCGVCATPCDEDWCSTYDVKSKINKNVYNNLSKKGIKL